MDEFSKIYIHGRSWDKEGIAKYGYTGPKQNSMEKRKYDSHEQHSYIKLIFAGFKIFITNDYNLGYKEFDDIIKLFINKPEIIEELENGYDCYFTYGRRLEQYKVENGGGTEFIKKEGLETLYNFIEFEFPKLGLKVVRYTDDEINVMNEKKKLEIKGLKATEERLRNEILEKLRKELKKKEMERKKNIKITNLQIKDEYKWFEREYQRTIIEYGIEQLTKLHKLYLELATGGGKSYIIYKILSIIKPKIIIIFSPRKHINKQNSSDRYLSLLYNDYLVYNCSIEKSFESFKLKCEKEQKKMIIVSCPQSQVSDDNHKVYDIIKNNNLNNIFIWFDEAHNTIENWGDKLDKLDNIYTKFFLENNDKISNRIYTSASPNKELVGKFPQIFGELYSPIKVKELIQLKWLCPINCKILEYDILNFNLLTWILDGFFENEKSFGFSFHSRDNNAFNLFYKHYQLYLSLETEIKPYLLIHDAGLNSSNKDKLKTIRLDYNFRNVTDFENKKEFPDVNPKNMAYVVKQYDMGYDFEKLDYIVITDPKVSSKDIIQCIGRGTRPDKKGTNGTNLDKELLLMLPTYVKEEDNNDYKNIIEVLRYLILDLDMDLNDMGIIKPNDSSESKETVGLDYKGTTKNSSKLLDLLYTNNILNRVNTKTLNKFCVKYSIKTEQDYYRFKAQNPSLNLKNNLYEYPGFYWKNVVDPNNEVYYSSKPECKKSKEKLINEYELKLNEEDYEEFLGDIEDNGWIELNKYDAKLPPYRDLDKYYPQL